MTSFDRVFHLLAETSDQSADDRARNTAEAIELVRHDHALVAFYARVSVLAWVQKDPGERHFEAAQAELNAQGEDGEDEEKRRSLGGALCDRVRKLAKQLGWPHDNSPLPTAKDACREQDGVLWADSILANFVAQFGETGQEAAEKIRAKAKETARGEADPYERWYRWLSWEEERPRFVTLLTRVLWHDVVGPELKRQQEAHRLAQCSSPARPIGSAVRLSTPIVRTVATGAAPGTWLLSPEDARNLPEGVAAVHGGIRLYVPSGAPPRTVPQTSQLQLALSYEPGPCTTPSAVLVNSSGTALGGGRGERWRTMLVMSAAAYMARDGVHTTLGDLARRIFPEVSRIQSRELRTVVEAVHFADACWLLSWPDCRHHARLFWSVLPSGLVKPKATDRVTWGINPGVAELDAGAVLLDLTTMLRLPATRSGEQSAATYLHLARAWDALRNPGPPKVTLSLNELAEWVGVYAPAPEAEPKEEAVKRVKRGRKAAGRMLDALSDMCLVSVEKLGSTNRARFVLSPPRALETAYREAVEEARKRREKSG